MSKILWYRVAAAIVFALFLSAPVLAQPSFGASGFTENFDSMGQDGVTPPDGWTVYTIPGSNGTWSATTGILPDQMSPEFFGRPSGGLTAVLFPSTPTAPTNNNGYNAATADTPDDRALTTSPTGVAGAVLELVLTNNTGGPVTTLSVAYDIRRFQIGSGGADELPGYWLFYSLDGGTTYTNVSPLNPDGKLVPNSVGVTHIPPTRITLTAPLADGESINFCWVDDNGVPSSPDEIIGLDNVSITIPSKAVSLAASGFAENFDSMGQDGTTPPPGWNVYTIPGNSATWLTSIPADQVSGGTPSTGLTATLDPTTRNNNGFNAATSDTPDDRALSTSPTSVSGAVLELVLSNDTGRDLTTLAVAYDIRRFTSAVGGAEELPGYWLFYSLDGGFSYTNVSALNPDINSVPDLPGVTNMSGQFDLVSPLLSGSIIIFRWVDDNGDAPSPDQILGLDNVSITAP
jgi:hypothetical protein